MAHFKRRRPRARTFAKRYDKWKAKRLEERYGDRYWLGSWPAWWDVLFHRRPARRAEAAMVSAVIRGDLDPDEAAWPLSKRPHKYWW